ncbi:hypothetical protein [Fastidiosibacter lacustris]|uniref:hypothetical protein n=1 Tax=Fastidiosibacter lacustris TaxID=2056695 RepID=UPI000E3436C4|nr:hypothetical protein [Fastidiosibacter lacustris]
MKNLANKFVLLTMFLGVCSVYAYSHKDVKLVNITDSIMAKESVYRKIKDNNIQLTKISDLYNQAVQKLYEENVSTTYVASDGIVLYLNKDLVITSLILDY